MDSNQNSKYLLNVNSIPSARVKQVGSGATKCWEICGMLQKHLLGTSSLVMSDRIVIVNEKSILEMFVHEQGSRTCKP